MISVCQLYNDFKGANNTWAKGHFRPDSFIYALHETQMEIFNALRKEWEESQVITDALRPFFKRVQKSIKNEKEGGMIEYPKGYCSFSSLRFYSKTPNGKGVECADIDTLAADQTICKREVREEDKLTLPNHDDLIERPIIKVDNQRWGAVQEHTFLKPSLEKPYATQYDSGFKVIPKKISVVVLDYLSTPERPVMPYTKDARMNFVCDLNNCTKLLWGDEMLPEIMSRLKTKYASFISSEKKYMEGVQETKIVGS